MSLDLTVTDLFCGAGGSSIGAEKAGARLRMAANHWSVAIETHANNFPHADHDCADVSQVDPRRYPTTDILIASPECTHHSQARSKRHVPDLFNPHADPMAERSRATMWDVPRFAERHRYQLVIVENVVEIRRWAPYEAWLAAMASLGYRHQTLDLNSMVAHPTPQSRDRRYIVFSREGNPLPDLDVRPRSYCRAHGDVEGVRTWKRPERPGGKYRQQYLYRCPRSRCGEVVAPYAWPAASAIDWSLPCPRIGDRVRPLAPATMRRIQVGLDRYGPAIIQAAGHTYERPGYFRTWPVGHPLPTQTADLLHGLVVPTHHDDSAAARWTAQPWPTQTGRQEHALVVMTHHAGSDPRYDGNRTRTTGDPLPTMTAQGGQALVELPFIAELRGGSSDASGIDEPLAAVCASGNHHGLVYPPSLMVKAYGDGSDPSMCFPPDRPLGTVTSQDHHGVLALPFLTSYYGTGGSTPIDEPVPTVTATDRHALVEPSSIDVEDCGFRMLEPHEVGRAMAFPDSYAVVGNKRQRVRQYGNAVTPPVMSLILERAIASLS